MSVGHMDLLNVKHYRKMKPTEKGITERIFETTKPANTERSQILSSLLTSFSTLHTAIQSIVSPIQR
jgi:hypothetical protein